MCPVARCICFECLWGAAKMLSERQLRAGKERSPRRAMLLLTRKLPAVFGEDLNNSSSFCETQGVFFGGVWYFLVWGRG